MIDSPTLSAERRPGQEPRITRALALILAAACGLIVADNYYVQPLLPTLGVSLHASSGLIGSCVTANQLGYAAGLVMLVPLGDLLPRRPLIVTMLCVEVLALLAAAVAPAVGVLLGALVIVGLTGSAINILIPLATTLADQAQRGRIVGELMTGLLMGILLARTVSGALGQAAGWRAVYVCAASATAFVAVILRFRLPKAPSPTSVASLRAARSVGTGPSPARRYRALLGSVWTLVRAESFLRRRMAAGALVFACFQLLWTTLPFLLNARPYHYDSAVIGLFGLLGVAGVSCAQPVGRLQDRGLARPAAGVLVLVLAASWAALAAGRHLAALIVGILLLDIAVQGIHVLNQSRMYTYPAALRSRVTTAYMTSYFLGGALGAVASTTLYTTVGWAGVCGAGLLLAVLSAALWLTDRGIATADPAAVSATGAELKPI